MIAEYEPFTRPKDFFRETEKQREHIEKLKSLGNMVFSPVDLMAKYGLEISNPPRFLEILMTQKPDLITQSGDEIGVRGKDVDNLITILDFQSQQLLEADVFPNHYREEVDRIFNLLSEQ